MKRIFYPIGQGAFYAERFSNFNIVYDCGVASVSKAAENVISQSFSKLDTINILFISHLDFDHVSLVKKLKDSVKSINHVILPHIDNREIVLKIYKKLKKDNNKYEHVIEILDNPSNFFGEGTKIIYVKARSKDDSPIEVQDTKDISNITDPIDSGTALTSSSITNWMYVPYNHRFQTRSTELETALKNAGFTDEDVSNLDKTLDNITDKAQRQKLKKAYEKVSGNINENSMFLYSGPTITSHHNWELESMYTMHHHCHRYHHCYFPICFDFHYIEDKPACIYCGDGDLNVVSIRTVFQCLMNMVGTIQIPHHGSIKNFNIDEIPKNTLCPLSVGKNTYGHPSLSVLTDIIEEGSCPICVTDNPTSFFVEFIR